MPGVPDWRAYTLCPHNLLEIIKQCQAVLYHLASAPRLLLSAMHVWRSVAVTPIQLYTDKYSGITIVWQLSAHPLIPTLSLSLTEHAAIAQRFQSLKSSQEGTTRCT